MTNEKRLIDANKLIDALEPLEATGGHEYHRRGANLVLHKFMPKLIAEQPTVDAVEVVHGQWIPIEYDGYADGNPVWDLWECSECQEEHSGDEDTLTPYCPNCGAKMDGGNEDG